MNNEQFRRLMLPGSAQPGSEKNGASSGAGPATSRGSTALGSRLKSSIPMTPRSVSGAGHPDFARQLAERRSRGDKPPKKLRTSVPKGSKLAEGYVDRSKTRADEEDDRATRIQALEEAFKNEEIDQQTYDRVRSEIAGGDLGSTHLVKGLDFKLLERIRKGEDVYGEEQSPEDQEQDKVESEPEPDVDDELDRLEAAEVQAVTREAQQKKGQFAPASLNPGQKRSRDQILAEMKAAREAAKTKEQSSLGSRFKKIGAKKAPGTRIERDSKGREVMIIVDEDGHERRKVRKIASQAGEDQGREEFVPDKNAEVLGMEVPEFYKQQLLEKQREEEAKEVKIFEDAGSDYDPLAELEDGSESEHDSDSDDKRRLKPEAPDAEAADADSKAMPPPPKPVSGAKNYFRDSKTRLTSEASYNAPSMNDPSFLAALRKAKTLGAAEKSEEEQKELDRQERLKKMLRSSNRDDEDLDMGFGTNRMEDEADAEEDKVKLSVWGEDDEDGGEGGGEGKSKRKRGPKKRKGDKNSLTDVMKVMERNKGGGS